MCQDCVELGQVVRYKRALYHWVGIKIWFHELLNRLFYGFLSNFITKFIDLFRFLLNLFDSENWTQILRVTAYVHILQYAAYNERIRSMGSVGFQSEYPQFGIRPTSMIIHVLIQHGFFWSTCCLEQFMQFPLLHTEQGRASTSRYVQGNHPELSHRLVVSKQHSHTVVQFSR